MRWWPWLVLAGCSGTEPKDGHSAEPGACALAEAVQTCPSCTDGPMRCSFGWTSTVSGTCGECQARHTLYAALCDAGETANADRIEAETVCEAVTCELRYDCACEPYCFAAPGPPTQSTTTPCTCPTPPIDPGTCAWNGAECAFE